MSTVEATQETGKKSATMGLVAVFFLYFAAMFLTQLLTVLQPVMATDLNGMALYSVGTAIPSLFGAFVTLIFGKLSDMFGRRIMIFASLFFYTVGAAMCGISSTMIMLIVSRCVMMIGAGAMATLCFAALGDIFPPEQRGKWAGLLNIPYGVCALLGPTLGGWISDTYSWRWAFWVSIPLFVIAFLLTMVGLPASKDKTQHKIDFAGAGLLAVASGTMLIAFSFAGSAWQFASVPFVGLMIVSIVFWVWFFKVEGTAAEPMFDPILFNNKVFLIASLAAFLSLFSMMGIMMYYPLFMQNVQGISATVSGQVVTPYTVLLAFMGVPAGFLVGKFLKYKKLFVGAYVGVALATIWMAFFTANSPIWMGVAVCFIAGLAQGCIPTINVIICQWSVPPRLIGAVTGGIFFFAMMGMAVAPAIQGSIMNMLAASGGLEAALRGIFLLNAITIVGSVIASFFVPEIPPDYGTKLEAGK